MNNKQPNKTQHKTHLKHNKPAVGKKHATDKTKALTGQTEKTKL